MSRRRDSEVNTQLFSDFYSSADFSSQALRLIRPVESNDKFGSAVIGYKPLILWRLWHRLASRLGGHCWRCNCTVSEDSTFSMTLSDRLRSQSELPTTPSDVAPCSCGVAPEGRAGGAFNEEMFHHFLTIETKRSERSNRPFLLLLLKLKQESGTDTNIDSAVAARLFAGLSQCLRETDFVGWYRERQVVGAVLTQAGGEPSNEIAQVVRQKLHVALRAGVASDPFHRLQVHVYQRPLGLKGRS